jgi:phosphoglycerate dehydrogenase-like enzyme
MIVEWVIMNILTASHRYNTLHSWQQKHTWGNQAEFLTVSSTVGKRLGILGYGAIGRQVASVVQRMGMDVVAYTASARESEESRRYNGYTIPGTGDPEGNIPSKWSHSSGLKFPS